MSSPASTSLLDRVEHFVDDKGVRLVRPKEGEDPSVQDEIVKAINAANPDKRWERNQVGEKAMATPVDLQSMSLLIGPPAYAADPLPPLEERDYVRFVAISDTHSKHDSIGGPDGEVGLPFGDVLLHAGDFTSTGKPKEVSSFAQYMKSQVHAHKIVIAGNHDLTLDTDGYPSIWKRFHRSSMDVTKEEEELREAVTLLEDGTAEVPGGLKVYGSPWSPEFYAWAFNVERGLASLKYWRQIPEDTDVLMTHGPPLGHGDKCSGGGNRAGCADLLDEVQNRVKPQYHIFGHIHEGYGGTTNGNGTTFINASTCTFRYQPNNPPVVFDVMKKAVA